MSEQFKIAVERAAYGGVLAGLGVGLTAYSTSGNVKTAVLAGIAATVAYLAARGGIEGYVDTQKAAKV